MKDELIGGLLQSFRREIPLAICIFIFVFDRLQKFILGLQGEKIAKYIDNFIFFFFPRRYHKIKKSRVKQKNNKYIYYKKAHLFKIKNITPLHT